MTIYEFIVSIAERNKVQTYTELVSLLELNNFKHLKLEEVSEAFIIYAENCKKLNVSTSTIELEVQRLTDLSQKISK